MTLHLIEILRCALGLSAGLAVGAAFGTLQLAALRRHERLERTGQQPSPWTFMPGSVRRIGLLFIALALVQIFCPMLFGSGREWWVSGGVVAGYGSILFWNFWQRRSRALG